MTETRAALETLGLDVSGKLSRLSALLARGDYTPEEKMPTFRQL